VISNFSVLNVYKRKTNNSKVVTQLLFGDSFKKLSQTKSWIKIKNDSDNYEGYIKNNKFPSNYTNTHKICSVSSSIYSKPNSKNKINKKLSFGSKVKIISKNGDFYKFGSYWIKKKNLKKINFTEKNIFKNINKFVNIKYKWGGKHYSGVDCSGLIQLFLNYNNKFCPRDTKDQVKYFKKKIKINKIRKNDLIFWNGHVALALSRKKLIHGYGPLKKVVIMPIKKTVEQIYKTANLKVIAIKRVV
jgi:cell wall-associated NlpC family hydrolase